MTTSDAVFQRIDFEISGWRCQQHLARVLLNTLQNRRNELIFIAMFLSSHRKWGCLLGFKKYCYGTSSKMFQKQQKQRDVRRSSGWMLKSVNSETTRIYLSMTLARAVFTNIAMHDCNSDFLTSL